MILTSQFLPFILIVIDVAAGLGYMWHGDLRRTVYWLAAATLTACVTF